MRSSAPRSCDPQTHPNDGRRAPDALRHRNDAPRRGWPKRGVPHQTPPVERCADATWHSTTSNLCSVAQHRPLFPRTQPGPSSTCGKACQLSPRATRGANGDWRHERASREQCNRGTKPSLGFCPPHLGSAQEEATDHNSPQRYSLDAESGRLRPMRAKRCAPPTTSAGRLVKDF